MKIDHVIIYKMDDYGIYATKGGSDSALVILADFLTDDTDLTAIPFIRTWIQGNTSSAYLSGNMTHISKKNNEIYFFYDWANNFDNPVLLLSQATFIDVLNQWEELLHQMPDEIDIEREGTRIVLKGRNK